MNNIINTLLSKYGYDVITGSSNNGISWLRLNALPIKTVFNIGANTGQFACSILPLFPDAVFIRGPSCG